MNWRKGWCGSICCKCFAESRSSEVQACNKSIAFDELAPHVFCRSHKAVMMKIRVRKALKIDKRANVSFRL